MNIDDLIFSHPLILDGAMGTELQKLDITKKNSHTNSIKNLKERMAQIKGIVTHSTTKKKQINIRVLESNLQKLKGKALEEDVPYQTLINSVVYKYVNGAL